MDDDHYKVGKLLKLVFLMVDVQVLSLRLCRGLIMVRLSNIIVFNNTVD